jgi:uracil-DNA glycosylase
MESIIDKYLQTDFKIPLLNLATKHKDNLSYITNIYSNDKLSVLPDKHLVFNAFNHFDLKDLRVCIIGQDPYPTKGNAMGLAFSIPNSKKCAASLRNIFKELEYEYQVKRTENDLSDWTKQGVLLLNTSLTVEEGSAGSHLKLWKPFINDLLEYIGNNTENVVYLLWGRHAQTYEKLINKENNMILKSVHPSPLAQNKSRGDSFIGNNHFTLANNYLVSKNRTSIDWIGNL